MVQCWLVERSYDDRNLIRLRYATTDGESVYQRELSSAALGRTTVTAAREVDPDDLMAVDEADRERYAAEARRMATEHDPDDEV
jgi:hypothetical protein